MNRLYKTLHPSAIDSTLTTQIYWLLHGGRSRSRMTDPDRVWILQSIALLTLGVP